MSDYTDIMKQIDEMIAGTGFSLHGQPEIKLWTNGPEVRLVLKKWENQGIQGNDPETTKDAQVQ